MKDFYSTSEVGEKLGVTPRRAWELVKLGRIPYVRHGRNIRIPVAAWEKYLEAQTQEALDTLGAVEGKGERHAAIA